MQENHLVSLHNWPADDIQTVLKHAQSLKTHAQEGSLELSLKNKTLALLFEKASMRTRVSFEVAMIQLGGASVYLSKSDVNLGKREPVKDGARVLSRYVNCIAARVFSHSTIEELAEYSDIPVINALSDDTHPCQALADVMTIREEFPDRDDISLAYVGDANNVARSLGFACAKLGINYRIAAPEGYEFDAESAEAISTLATEGESDFEMTNSPEDAVANADVLYADTWISMGQEEESAQRLKDFQGYGINKDLCNLAAANHIVLHCLPAYRGNEITDSVIEGPASRVFDQAENRLHAQRALLDLLVN
ncbi:MAG: ornithine carbamoyltransferase [Candidatus Brocadiia bacterium]